MDKTKKKTPSKKKTKPEGYVFGRPTAYNKAYCKGILEFFNREPFENETLQTKKADGTVIDSKVQEVPCKFPTFERYAASIGVCVDTLNEWTKVYPDFSESYKQAKAYQKDILITNALRGNYNPVFSIFTAKNCTDMRDKVVVEHENVASFVTRFRSDSEKI